MFVRPRTVVQIGLPPSGSDLLTEIRGVTDFAAAWSERTEQEVGGRSIPFLGRATTIEKERATGRLRDWAGIEAPGEDV